MAASWRVSAAVWPSIGPPKPVPLQDGFRRPRRCARV